MPDYKIGELAKFYETGGKGPGYISNGATWGDPGGDSYGSYQLESKQGTIQAYIATKDPYTLQLKNLTVNTREFKEKWRDMADKDPEGFQQSQFDFLYNKREGGAAAYQYAKQLGWDADNFALHSAIFSTSNQSGRWRKGIFALAGIKMGDSIETQINKLYDARAAYFKRIKLPLDIKESIMRHRCGKNLDMGNFKGRNERFDCLKLARG